MGCTRHRFQGWLVYARLCQSTHDSSRQWLLDVRPTADVLLQSLIFLLQPPKPAPAGLPAPSSCGRLWCRVGCTGPPYSLRWPGHPSTHPHLLLFSDDGNLTPQPNYSTIVLSSAWASTVVSSPAPGRPIPRPHRRPPHWGSRRGVLNIQQMTAIGIGMYVEMLIVGTPMVHGRTQATASLLRKKMIPPTDIWGTPVRRLTYGPTKLTRTQGFVNLVNKQF